MQSISQGLVKAIQKGDLVPFVGAGLSMSVGRNVFPNWDGLIRKLAERLKAEGSLEDSESIHSLCEQGRLPEAAEQAFFALTKQPFIEEMQKAFEISRPRDANLSAVEALWRIKPRLVITTNYDSVLEWPFMALPGARAGSSSQTLITVAHNDDPAILQRAATLGDRTFIWHLHGSIRRPDTLILTGSQYRRLYGEDPERYKLYEFALDQLRDVLAKRPMLFVGFSLQDPFVREQIREVLKLTSRGSPVSYMLVRKGDGESLLDEYHVRRVEFEDFGAPMVTRLIEIGLAAWGDQYRAGIGPEPEPVPEMEPLIEKLNSLLDKVVLEPAQVAWIFNKTKPPALEFLPLFGDGWRFMAHAISHLGAALRQGDDGPFPILEFVQGIEDFCPAAVRKQLGAWRRAAAAILEPDEARQGRLLEGFPERNKFGTDTPYVLVRMTEKSDNCFRVQAWLFDSATPYKLFQDERDDVKRKAFGVLVNDILATLEAMRIDIDRAMLAFLLPRRLLIEDVDQWQPQLRKWVAELPIGATHTVSVRSLDRLSEPRFRMRLRETWESFQAAGGRTLAVGNLTSLADCSGHQAVWLSPGDADRPGFVQELEGQVICAVLSAAPPAEPVEPMHDLLNAVLQSGVPVVLWAREPVGSDPVQARAEFEKLLARAPLQELAKQIRLHRWEAATGTDPSHPGRCLTLLWDDPDRLPPDQDRDNSARVLRE